MQDKMPIVVKTGLLIKKSGNRTRWKAHAA